MKHFNRESISHDILKANYDVNDLVWASDNIVRRVTKKLHGPYHEQMQLTRLKYIKYFMHMNQKKKKKIQQ